MGRRMSKWTLTDDPVVLRRMGKTLEELGELVAVCGRVIIQGLDEVDPGTGRVNRVRLSHELADVLAQCRTTVQAMGLDEFAIAARQADKERQMDLWESLYDEEVLPA